MLEQAVDELQFLQKQEERTLESQVRLIREVRAACMLLLRSLGTATNSRDSAFLLRAQSYALRLEVFQQQYLNKVAEIEDEMYASIQKRQEECDATVLAAARKLQDQTQHALLQDLATASRDTIKEQVDSSSFSTASSSASQSKPQRLRRVRPLRHDALSSPRQPSRVAPMPTQASPVSKQRAKLQALEAKLAAFSPESLNRVKNELAMPVRRAEAARPHVKPTRAPTTTSRGTDEAGGRDEWRVSPLSPLRQGPSYWRAGVSLEARGREEGSVDQTGETSPANPTRKQAPASLLSRRFLRPEEEEELRHLRASVGLAKDWMASSKA
jgi:hypothetical protein